jgi:hypothetical protein
MFALKPTLPVTYTTFPEYAAGADVAFAHSIVFDSACRANDVQTVAHLLSTTDIELPQQRGMLTVACRDDSVELVELLLHKPDMIPHQYHIAQEPWISVRTVRVALAVLAYAEQPGNVLDANLTPYSLMRVRKGEAFLPPAKF